jgi:hypothetical protein
MPQVTAEELTFNAKGYANLNGVTVTECCVVKPEDKSPSISFTFETIDGRHAYCNKYLSPNAVQYTQGTMRDAFGFEGPLDELLVAVTRGDFVGARCNLSFKVEEWQGDPKLKVSGIWPARETATDDDLANICAGLGYEFKPSDTAAEPTSTPAQEPPPQTGTGPYTDAPQSDKTDDDLPF